MLIIGIIYLQLQFVCQLTLHASKCNAYVSFVVTMANIHYKLCYKLCLHQSYYYTYYNILGLYQILSPANPESLEVWPNPDSF